MKPKDFNAKMVGYVYEGGCDVRVIDEVSYDAFYDIMEHGGTLWDASKCSKYIIAVIADIDGESRMVGCVRPDRHNFENPTSDEILVKAWQDADTVQDYEAVFGDKNMNELYQLIFKDDYEFDLPEA